MNDFPRETVAPVHPAALEEAELLKHCRITFGRQSGPGGQNRNKVETGVVILHQPTGESGRAGERRSQGENRAVALFRLRVNLALSQRGYHPLRGVPSTRWQSRTGKAGRVAVNPKHVEFPALLAEALDVLDALKWDIPKAAVLLNCTSSQLLKFLKEEPQAWVLLNKERALRHKRMLK